MIRSFYTLAAVVAGLLWAAPSALAINTVLIELDRIDDYVFPGQQFGLEVEIELPDVAGVGAVSIVAGGVSHPLIGEPPNWLADGITFANLAAMKSALDGAWTIVISGSSPSTTSLTMSLSALTEADFFATPTNLAPADGSTNVSPDVMLSWSDSTGASQPLTLAVGVENGQDAISLFGDIAVGATSWQPPFPLSNGVNEFFVSYLNLTDGNNVPIPTLNVISGLMDWSTDPNALDLGYPAQAPLILLGGSSAVHFTVPEPAAALQALTALLMLGGLSRRRVRLA